MPHKLPVDSVTWPPRRCAAAWSGHRCQVDRRAVATHRTLFHERFWVTRGRPPLVDHAAAGGCRGTALQYGEHGGHALQRRQSSGVRSLRRRPRGRPAPRGARQSLLAPPTHGRGSGGTRPTINNERLSTDALNDSAETVTPADLATPRHVTKTAFLLDWAHIQDE